MFRDHPLLVHNGTHSWPPVWTQGYAPTAKRVTGEIGVLKHVTTHPALRNKVYLIVEHEGERYTGCLMMDDTTFCAQITHLLHFFPGRAIKEIGDLDLGHLL